MQSIFLYTKNHSCIKGFKKSCRD